MYDVTSLFTENCTEETRKSKLRNEASSCTHRFSSLRSSTEESVESNRIDFPKQIRIKRKYLKSQDAVCCDMFRHTEFCDDVGLTPKILPDARKMR